MIVLDTAPIVAAADRKDPLFETARAAIQSADGPLILSPLIIAEADYLLSTRVSPRAANSFLQDIIAGRFRVECLLPEEYVLLKELQQRYADLAPGLADLSVVALAHRFRTDRILTFDQRHFRALRGFDNHPFQLLPIDA